MKLVYIYNIIFYNRRRIYDIKITQGEKIDNNTN